MRCGRGLLGTGVHVAFVVQTEIDEILIALRRRGQALKADVVGTAVAGQYDHLSTLLALDVECAAQPGGRGGAGFECRLIHGDAQRTVAPVSYTHLTLPTNR